MPGQPLAPGAMAGGPPGGTPPGGAPPAEGAHPKGREKNYFIFIPFIVGGVIVALVVSMLVLAGVPVSHTEAFSFSIVDPGSFNSAYNQTMVFSHSGTVTFTFNTLDHKGVIFSLLNDTKATLYQSTSSSGGATFSASAGQTFTFQIFTYSGDTVSVSGAQSYTAPTL